MQIDRATLRLPETEYFHGEHSKSLIVLHHTVGGSARSTFDWWKKDPKRIGTAYLVERDGTVFEVFPPEYWASHVAAKDEQGNWLRSLERHSIGIEICSEGALKKIALAPEDGTGEPWGYFAFDGRKRIHADSVWQPAGPWRGQCYFAAYTPAQFAATAELVRMLCEKFRIPQIAPADHLNYKPEYYRFSGVLGHAHLRPDKSDPSPQIWNPGFLAAAGLSLA